MLHGSSRRFSFPSHLHQPHLSFARFFCCWITPRLHHQINATSPQFSITTRNEVLDFFADLLQQCATLQHSKQIHAQIILTYAHRSAFLAARLQSIYARFGFLAEARRVFETTPFECASNLLLWNSILRANVSHGDYQECLRLYVRMRKLGLEADGFTFPLVIRACALMGCYNLCKIVHGHVILMGFQSHLHAVNELMGMYGKLGRMDFARQLFDKMACRSYISWNTMFSGFALNYDYDSAIKMFQRMESEGLEPNLVTWTSLLSSHARCGRQEETMELYGMMRMRGIGATAEALAVVLSVCADSDFFEKGKVIHGYVIKAGFEDYSFVKNSLVCVYGKHGHVTDAKNLFLEMETKSLVSCNALIASYAESGFCDEAFAIFSQLDNWDTYPKVRPNVISWSAVIGGFASKGRGEESLQLFRKMQIAKVAANCVTISTVLSVCAELSACNLGREIHAHVVRALMDGNSLVGNGLINMYTKCGSFKAGCLVFENFEDKDLISWNSMIAGYGMHGFGEKSLGTFNQMIEAGVKPDGVTFVAVLSACSHAGLVAEGRKVFNQMIRDFRIEPQLEHYACMVDLLGRAGFLQEASEMVKSMPMEPNACVWGALLNSCRMYKNTEVAERTASHIFSLNSEMTGSYMLLSNIYAACGRWEDSARVRISAKTKGLKKIPGQSWIEVKKKVYIFSSGKTMHVDLEEVYGILEELALQMEIEGYTPNISFACQDDDETDMIWEQ
ncbi:putative pentatricopeptide repeat-containing protein At1g17630 [Malania oleifera]|uniref:putative pentatricopeptide repeat-containing protein At1g17630 n=1 Tax=Malania oleifera TaxID=397392 RepID=UPI0025ADF2BD|nr:putative pentatricopeptide repeat-containing protein At1g17630 [Malania oleifera]